MKRAEQSVRDLIAPQQRNRIIRYLLDQMNEAERIDLEEEMEHTPALFDVIASVEDELIFSYLRNELDIALSARFAEAYLEDAGKRARVDQAEVLRNAVRQVSITSQQQRQRSWRLRLAIVSAVAAILLSIGLGLLWHNSRRLTARLQPVPRASFSLSPGLTRSGGGAQIAIPPGVREIEFTLQASSVPADKAYPAVLGTPERPDAWRGEALPRNSNFELTVPTDVLLPGDYTLELQTGAENAATYHFRVEKAK